MGSGDAVSAIRESYPRRLESSIEEDAAHFMSAAMYRIVKAWNTSTSQRRAREVQ